MSQEAFREPRGTPGEDTGGKNPQEKATNTAWIKIATTAIFLAYGTIAVKILKGLREKISDRRLQEEKVEAVEAEEQLPDIDFSVYEMLGRLAPMLPSEKDLDQIRRRNRRKVLTRLAAAVITITGTPSLLFGIGELAHKFDPPDPETQRIEAQKALEERREKREQEKKQEQREKESTNPQLPTPYPEQGIGPLPGEEDLPEGLTFISTETPPPTPPPTETPPPVETLAPPETKTPPESPPPLQTPTPTPTPTPEPTPTPTPLKILQ